MSVDDIIKTNLNICSLYDDNGRRYFNVKVSFSEEDVLTIYRNSMDELLEDLPSVLLSAIRARIIQEQPVY